MRQLSVFAKYWEPGRVKSRLASAIGSVAAASLYRQFLRSILQRLSRIGERRVLVYSPQNRSQEFRSLAGVDWEFEPQEKGDLGKRLKSHIDLAFASGADSVVVIGSDSPNVPIRWIDEAFGLLRNVPAVLGPTIDGGYYLVGASEATPPVFDDVEWSSARVWEQTVAHLRQAKSKFATVPRWYDVDLIDDLRRLKYDLDNTTDAGFDALRDSIQRVFQEQVADG